MSHDLFRRYIDIVTESAAHAVTEMDKSQPSHGRDGHVSHSTYGSRDKEGSDYFKGKESPVKPISVKQMEKDALDILKKQGVAEGFGTDPTQQGTWHGHKIIANRKTPKGSFLIIQNKNDGKYEIHKHNPGVVGGLEFVSVHKTPEEMQAAFRQLTGVDESQQGVAEGLAPGQAAWKKEMTAKGAVSFKRDQHGGGTVDRIVAYDKDGKVVGGFNRKSVAEGTKALADYIAESERAYSQPVPGDYFAINIREETLFETWVCDETPDGIVIYADDQGLALLERYGYLGEAISEGHDFEIDSDEDSVDVVDQGEYDQEGDMAKDDLATIVRAARRLTGMLDDNDNLPEWVQAKITKAADYVDTAADYIENNRERDGEQGSLNEGQYEMMKHNGHVKKFHANNDADAIRFAKDHGAKSLIRLKRGAPPEKVFEQDMAEGLPGGLSKSDYTPGKTVTHTSSNCTTCHGRKIMYKVGGKLFPDNKQGATKVKCPTCKGTGDKQGVAEGKKPDRYHIVGKDGKPADLASYPDRASAEQVRDKKYPDAVVQQVGPRGKVKGVAEGSNDKPEAGDKIIWYHSNHYPELEGEVVGWKDGHLIVKSIDPSPRNTEKTVATYRVPKNNIMSVEKQGVAEGIFDFKKQPMPEHGDELKIGDRYVIFDDGGSHYGVSWIKQDRSEAYEEFDKSEYTNLKELKKAIWDEIKYQDQQSVAEGSLEEVSLDLAKRARDKAEKHVDWDEDDMRDRPEGYSEKQRSKFQRYIDRKEPRAKGDRDWDPLKQGVAEGKVSGYKMYPNHDGTWYVEDENENVVLRNASKGEAEYAVWTGNEKLKQGVAEGAKCNHTMKGTKCPVHGLKECGSYGKVEEMSVGSVATVVNPPAKNKSKVGTLFGGTYKQKKVREAKQITFPGEKTKPPQKPGDQVRGTEKATKPNPFKHRLVGNGQE